MTALELTAYQQSLLDSIVSEVPKRGEKSIVSLLYDTLTRLRAINMKKAATLDTIDGEPIPKSLQDIIGALKPFSKEELASDDRLTYIMSK